MACNMIWVPRGKGRDMRISWVFSQASGTTMQTALWKGVHAATGHKLRISTRRDREFLMVLYENGRQVLCNRIDACGAIVDCKGGLSKGA